MSLSCAIFNRLKFCAHLTASSFFPKLSTFNFLYSCLTRQSFSDGGSIFNIIAFFFLATSLASASCTLQLHAIDVEGHAWGNDHVTISNGTDVLLDNWSMTEPYLDQVEFEYFGDSLQVLIETSHPEHYGSGYALITNDQGHTLFHFYLYLRDYEKTFEEEFEFTCDQTDETLISQWAYAKPDVEPECHDGYEDTYNGGCYAETQVFTDIQSGETVFGSVSRYFGDNLVEHDEDWYRFTVDRHKEIDISGFSETPIMMEILGHENCENIDLKHHARFRLNEFYENNIFLHAGEYLIRIAPVEHLAYPCDSGKKYVLALLTDAQAIETSCSTENEPDCFNGFDEQTNDICESLEDSVSELKIGCVNKGTTGFYIRDGEIVKDVDYYRLRIWEEEEIPLLIESACALTVTFFEGDCVDHMLLDSIAVSPFEGVTMSVGLLAPGDYLLQFEPEENSGVACGSSYRFLLDGGRFGNRCNNSDQMSTSGFYDSSRYSFNRGDTTFAENNYSAEDYGCGDHLHTPETVHRIQVSQRVTVSAVLEAEDWRPRLVVTREWPPEECYVSTWSPATPTTATVPKVILEPDVTYFFFCEGQPEHSGRYDLRINRIDPSYKQLEVELTLNQDHYLAGDQVLVTGNLSNPTQHNEGFLIGLILEVEGAYWHLNADEEWDTDAENFPHGYLYIGTEIERTFIDCIWPNVSFQGIKSSLTLYLFDFDQDHIPYLKSNVETEEFLF